MSKFFNTWKAMAIFLVAGSMLMGARPVRAENLVYISTRSGAWANPLTWGATGAPAVGDSVTIANGTTVTVEGNTVIGTGSGDAILMNGPSAKLEILADLTVRGGIRFPKGGEINVRAINRPAGIILEGNAGTVPTIQSNTFDSATLRFEGTADHRCFLKGAPTTPGLLSFGTGVIGFRAVFTDITDMGTKDDPGVFIQGRNSDVLIERCIFRRSSLRLLATNAPLLLSHTIFAESRTFWTTALTVTLDGGELKNLNIVNNGFDGFVEFVRVNSVTGNAFGNMVAASYPSVLNWSDNLVVVPDPDFGFTVTQTANPYRRTYILHTSTSGNPHVSGVKGGKYVVDQFIWDIPIAPGHVDDTFDAFGSADLDAHPFGAAINLVIQRSLLLPRLGGGMPTAGFGLGFWGTEDPDNTSIKYIHNTIAMSPLFWGGVIAAWRDHGEKPKIIKGITNNIFYLLDSAGPGPQDIFLTEIPDLVDDAAQVSHNARYHATYTSPQLTTEKLFTTGTPGANDVVDQNPDFVDPTRCLITYWRAQTSLSQGGSVEDDLLLAVAWMIQNPWKIGEPGTGLIDWVRAGYAPQNPAYKAANDTDVEGWIGAVVGNHIATSYLLRGPATGVLGRNSSRFTLTPDGSFNGSIVLSDGNAGGEFTPQRLTWTNSGQPQVSLYRPAAVGTVQISALDDKNLADPPPLFLKVKDPSVPAYTLTGPATARVGRASSPLIITPLEKFTGTVELNDGQAGGTFSRPSLSWSDSSDVKTLTYTPARTGPIFIFPTNNSDLTDPKALFLEVTGEEGPVPPSENTNENTNENQGLVLSKRGDPDLRFVCKERNILVANQGRVVLRLTGSAVDERSFQFGWDYKNTEGSEAVPGVYHFGSKDNACRPFGTVMVR